MGLLSLLLFDSGTVKTKIYVTTLILLIKERIKLKPKNPGPSNTRKCYT